MKVEIIDKDNYPTIFDLDDLCVIKCVENTTTVYETKEIKTSYYLRMFFRNPDQVFYSEVSFQNRKVLIDAYKKLSDLFIRKDLLKSTYNESAYLIS